MRLATVALALPLALAPLLPGLLQGRGGDQDPPSVRDQRELVEEFLELDGWVAEDAVRRAAILAELERVPPLTARDLKDWTKRIEKLWKDGPELESSSGRHYLREDPDRGLYIVGGNTSKPKGLLVAMHGGGLGSGDAGPAAAAYQGAAKQFDLVMIAPQVLEATERGWTDSGTEEFVVELVERALRTWKIDRNRVYFAGHSMGGYGTWTLGAHHADLVAGLAPSAGAPTPILGSDGQARDIIEGVVPNLRNVPIRIYQSDDDVQVPPDANRVAAKKLEEADARWGGYDFEYWEVTGRGHGAPPGGYEAHLAKIVELERVTRPERVVWQPTLTWRKDFYWLHWDEPYPRAVVVADVDREANAIDVTVSGGTGEGLSFWLDDRLVDLERELVVRVGGEEVWRGAPEARLADLVRSAARWDAEYLFAHRVGADLTPAAPTSGR